MVRVRLAMLPLGVLAATPVGAAELDPNEKGYAIHEFFLPAATTVAPHIDYESSKAWAECQISELENSLSSMESLKEAVWDLPRYMKWSAGKGEKPGSAHETALANAHEACQEYAQRDYGEGLQTLAPAVKDVGINDIVLPAIKDVAPHMSEVDQRAWAECQVGVLEKMLDSPVDTRAAMQELPLYIQWSDGGMTEKPDFQYGNAVMNAYMQCVE